MRELYTQVIMEHYQRPRNRGKLEDADLEEHLLNPLCGDEVVVYGAFNGDRVAEVRFSGRGCAISQASASMMTERLSGKSLKEAEAEIEMFKEQMVGKKEFPKLDELAALKGVVKYPSRIKCAVLAWSAFHEGLSKGARGSEERAIPEE